MRADDLPGFDPYKHENIGKPVVIDHESSGAVNPSLPTTTHGFGLLFGLLSFFVIIFVALYGLLKVEDGREDSMKTTIESVAVTNFAGIEYKEEFANFSFEYPVGWFVDKLAIGWVKVSSNKGVEVDVLVVRRSEDDSHVIVAEQLKVYCSSQGSFGSRKCENLSEGRSFQGNNSVGEIADFDLVIKSSDSRHVSKAKAIYFVLDDERFGHVLFVSTDESGFEVLDQIASTFVDED